MDIEIKIPYISEKRYIELVNYVRSNGRDDSQDIVYLNVNSGGYQKGESSGEYNDVILRLDDCDDQGDDFEEGRDKVKELMKGLLKIIFSGESN